MHTGAVRSSFSTVCKAVELGVNGIYEIVACQMFLFQYTIRLTVGYGT